MVDKAKNDKARQPCTDEEALEWLRDGSLESESKAIECLYRRLLGVFRPWAYSKSGTSDDVHDAVTEAIIAFVQNFRETKYRHEGKLEHYLFRIAQRKFYDVLSERGDAVSFDDLDKGGIPEKNGEEESDPVVQLENDAEALARQDKLQSCLEQLGERCKERIRRFWYMDQSHKEIAEALGDASPDVSKARKDKCQKLLAKCMKGQP